MTKVTNNELVIELFENTAPGTVVTYREIALRIGLDERVNRPVIQQIVSSIRGPLLDRAQRALVNERNVGYRVAAANEHAGIADRGRRRARRTLSRAHKTATQVRLSELTPAERDQVLLTGAALEAQLRLARKSQARQIAFGSKLNERGAKQLGQS